MSWRAIFAADLHLSNSLPHAKPIEGEDVAPGMTDRFLDQLDVVDQIGEVAKERKAQAIFLLGDVWDRRLLDAVTLRHSMEAILKLSKAARVYILPGNHDANSPKSRGSAHRFTSEVFEAIGAERIMFLNGSAVLCPSKLPIEFFPLPWAPLDVTRQRLEKMRTSRRDDRQSVLLFHQSVIGAWQQGWKCDDGLTQEELCDGWDMALGGHFHTPQDVAPPSFNGVARYVGAPMQLHFGDSQVVDGEVIEVEFQKDSYMVHEHSIDAPRFYVCGWQEKVGEKLYEGDYIRFTVEATHAEFLVRRPQAEARAEKLREAGINAHVQHVPVQQHEARLELSSHPSDEEALSRYLDLADTTGLDVERLKQIAMTGIETVRQTKEVTVGAPVDFLLLRIEDFCSIEKAELDLYQQGMSSIVGINHDTDAATSNGSGKSNIPKALTWCLFGETLDGDRYDEVIRYEQKQAKVSVIFRTDNESWEVERIRKKGSPALTLRHGTEAWGGDAKEVQAKIVDLLGLDFRGFCNVVLYGSGDNNRFFSSTDTVQKETIHRILRTDHYRKAEKWARGVYVELEKAHDETRHAIVATEQQFGEHDLDDLQRQVDNWQKERDEELEAYRAVLESLDTDLEAQEGDFAQERAGLEESIEEAERRKKTLTALWKERAALQEKRDELRERMEKFRRSRDELQTEIRVASDKLADLHDDNCPTCTAPLSKGAPAKFIKAQQATIDRFSPPFEAASAAYRDTSALLQEKQDELRRLPHSLDDDLRQAQEELSGFRGELMALDGQLQSKKDEIRRDAEHARQRVEQLRNETNPHRAQLAKTEARLKELREELQRLSDKEKSEQVTLAHYEFWVRGFGVRGLPSLLLDSTMPFIGERSNRYLETLSDGDITVEFSNQRELKKKGEKRDEIEITWTIEGVPNVRPSAGQKKKMEVSSNFALGDLAMSREHSGVNLLFLDEVLDGLDKEGVSRVLRLLQRMRTKRSSVFVITHEEGLSEAFERTLCAEKKNGVTRVDTKEAA